jgi:hypothetical protein
LCSSVGRWNAWREAHPEIRPDVSGAHLRQAKLSGAYLYETNLNGASLNSADLIMVHLDRRT